MIDICTLLFRVSDYVLVADKSGNVNQSQNAHIWQCQIIIGLPDQIKALPLGGLEKVLKYSAVQFFPK